MWKEFSSFSTLNSSTSSNSKIRLCREENTKNCMHKFNFLPVHMCSPSFRFLDSFPPTLYSISVNIKAIFTFAHFLSFDVPFALILFIFNFDSHATVHLRLFSRWTVIFKQHTWERKSLPQCFINISISTTGLHTAHLPHVAHWIGVGVGGLPNFSYPVTQRYPFLLTIDFFAWFSILFELCEAERVLRLL